MSTHSSKVIDDFMVQSVTKQHALAFFYCNYREESRRDPTSLLRELVKQLCLSVPGALLPEPVVSIHQGRLYAGNESSRLRLSECRDLIVQLLTAFSQTTIIIDALDECNRDTRRDLILVLKHIITSTEHVRIFLTSRTDGDIQRLLWDFPSYYINATDNAGDIGVYIKSEIERCSREELLLEGEADEQLKTDIITALEMGANGMYVLGLFRNHGGSC